MNAENCQTCGQSHWAERKLTIATKALKDIKNLRGTVIPHSAAFEAGELANKALGEIISIRVSQVIAEEADACFPEGKTQERES